MIQQNQHHYTSSSSGLRAQYNHWRRLGFTIVELCAIIVVVVVLCGAIAPAIGQIRTQARAAKSSANLMSIGQARDMYALDNTDRIYTYTWRAGETYLLPNGMSVTPSSDVDAAIRQNTEIITRRSGRISGPYKITNSPSRLPHRRFAHLTLMDYMAGNDDSQFPGTVFTDPDDGDLLNWQENPLSYRSGSTLPYADGMHTGFDISTSWTEDNVRQRWAFATSYFSTTSAWQPDGINGEEVYVPISSTPHLYTTSGGGAVDLTGRYMSQVAFPSMKVHLFEEFDREQKRRPYFAYDHAKPEKLMFDGSINTQISGESNSAWNASQPGPEAWTQVYVPLHTFPIPVDGLLSNERVDMHYMWTEHGLQGIDYPTAAP